MKLVLFALLFVLLLRLSSTSARRPLREYLIRDDPLPSTSPAGWREQLTISSLNDEEDIFCRLESYQLAFLRYTRLYAYPSRWIFASFQQNRWTHPLYLSGQLRVYDDEYDGWLTGQITEDASTDALRLRIEYHGQVYLMEQLVKSPTIQLRAEKRREMLLGQFSPRLPSSSRRTRLQIFSNELPDPLYIVAFSLFKSPLKMKTKTNK